MTMKLKTPATGAHSTVAPVPFPANVIGTNGINVTKANGVWTIKSDYSLASHVTPNDPANSKILYEFGGIYKTAFLSEIVGGGGATPGGSSGQIQSNVGGVFGGFTVGGDGTLDTGTGVLTITKTNGVNLGTFATQNYATPPVIGGTTPNTINGTTLNAKSGIINIDASGGQATLQIGTASVAASPYIDFHAGAGNAGRDIRLIGSSLGSANGSGLLTLEGSLAITPIAATSQQGFSTTQSGPTAGTTAGVALNASLGNAYLNYNLINVDGEGTDVTGVGVPYATALLVGMRTGGTNSAKGKSAGTFNVYHDTDSSPAASRDHVALNATGMSAASEGGTNTGAGAKGTMFGVGAGAILNTGATNYLEAAAGEFDVGIKGTATAKWAFGVSVVNVGDKSAAALDAAYEIGGASWSWKTGIVLANIHGAAPLLTTGTVIGTDGSTVTIANFADLSTYTITGNIFNFANFQVTGAGAVVMASLQIQQTPATVGTGAKTISNAADSSTNFGHYISVNMNGTTYYIPASSVAPT